MTDNHEHITRIDPNKVQNRSSRSVSKQEPTKPTKAPYEMISLIYEVE